ncbi:MAG: hypothetical protein FIB08_10380 [Candidatus Methanoperedens sp.]|nr:hypothetical protein [Candidatus Methanoperedens sp.]
MNFIEKVKGFLIKPSKTFDASKDDTLIEALKYYLIIAAIHSAFGILLWMFVLSGNFVLPPSYILLPLYVTLFGSVFGKYWGITLGREIEGALLTFLILLIFRTLRVFIGGAILHACLIIVGRKKGITQAIKALMYGSTPAFLFHLIPVIGFFAVMWSLVLEIIGTRQLQEITTGRAIVAVFMSIIIVVILSVILEAIINTFVAKPLLSYYE